MSGKWLEKRLTKPRREEERWVELAQAVEAVWEGIFDPKHQRLVDLRSAYTAWDEDLIKRIQERGDYFNRGYGDLEERSISVPWRRLELEYKDLELVLDLAFKRHFGHVEASWYPLMAPKGLPYGTEFRPRDGVDGEELKNVPPEGWWLTSRGMLGVGWASLMRKGISKADFTDLAIPILLRTKPLHILFDGLLYFIRHEVPFEDEESLWRGVERWQEALFSVRGARFDELAADVRPVDSGTMDLDRLTERRHEFPFQWPLWSLDSYLPMDLALRWNLPVDRALPGVEGDRMGLSEPVRESIQLWSAPCQPADWEAGRAMGRWQEATADASPLLAGEAERAFAAEWADEGEWLDSYPRFDEVRADFCPLDMPYVRKRSFA